MSLPMVLLGIVFIPTLGAFALPLVGRANEDARNGLAFLLVLASFILTLALLAQVSAGHVIQFRVAVPLGFDFTLTADRLAIFMALSSLVAGLVIVLYSFDYIRSYANRNEYYMLVVLFLGAMMGIVFSSNLVFLYVFWEMTAFVSWRLIGFFRGPLDVRRADKAFLVTAFGAVVMLVGFLALYQQTGSFDLHLIKVALHGQPVSNLVFVLVLFGIFSKSAILPFHTWLPDAGVAPSPVTALLHAAVLVKIGVYVFARLFVATLHPALIWQTIVPLLAASSTLVAAGAALRETDLKRIIAYSTTSQIGFILFGLSLCREIAVAGALLYIFMHGIAKAGLFLCAGIVEHKTKTKDITKLGGLFATMPLTGVAFLVCAASVMGLPPTGGFFSKYLLFRGSLESGQLYLTFLFLAAAVMTILYLLRVFSSIFLGQAKVPAQEGSPLMVACVLGLALLSVAAGIYVHYPLRLAEKAAVQMLQVAP